jgi:hypothetical protein
LVEFGELQCIVLAIADSLVISRFYRSRDQSEDQCGECDKHSSRKRHHFYSLVASMRWGEAGTDEHSETGAEAQQCGDDES